MNESMYNSTISHEPEHDILGTIDEESEYGRNSPPTIDPFLNSMNQSETSSDLGNSFSDFRDKFRNKKFMPSLRDIDETAVSETREEYVWRWAFFGIPIFYTYSLIMISMIRMVNHHDDGMTLFIFWYAFAIMLTVIVIAGTIKYLKRKRPGFEEYIAGKRMGNVYEQQQQHEHSQEESQQFIP